MRRIPLKNVPIRLPGQPAGSEPIMLSYADNLVGIINSAAGERGVPLSEISKLLRVLGPIEQAMESNAEFCLLEDADWQYLTKLLEAFRGWRIVHAAVPAFVKDITEAECIERAGVLSATT
jgi:hypothetical protein